MVAKHVSLAAPHHLSSIVLSNSVGAWGGWRSVIETLCRCAICIPLEIRFIASLIPHASINIRRHLPNLWAQLVAASHAEARHVADDVRVPTLLAWSAHDYVEPLACLRRLRRAIPHARVYVSCRGSHDWLIDRADEFAGAVAAFARGVARD